MTYGIPAFRLNGMLVGFGAAARHCALYLMTGSTVEAHRAELSGYDTSKGTVRFTPAKPLRGARAQAGEGEGRREPRLTRVFIAAGSTTQA